MDIRDINSILYNWFLLRVSGATWFLKEAILTNKSYKKVATDNYTGIFTKASIVTYFATKRRTFFTKFNSFGFISF